VFQPVLLGRKNKQKKKKKEKHRRKKRYDESPEENPSTDEIAIAWIRRFQKIVKERIILRDEKPNCTDAPKKSLSRPNERQGEEGKGKSPDDRSRKAHRGLPESKGKPPNDTPVEKKKILPLHAGR